MMFDKKNVFKQFDEFVYNPEIDGRHIDYDLNKHNWSEWFLESARELKPSLTRLEDIHLHFSVSELLSVRQQFEKLSRSREFSQRVDSFFQEYITPLLGRDDYLLQSTCGIRVVVPDQIKLGRLLVFHNGYWTGYNNQTGTVWTPLTEAYDTNTMQMVSFEETRKLMDKIYEEKLEFDEIQELCYEKCFPINLKPGQSWLFNQANLHGNVNNETGYTRVSFDCRWALPEGNFGIRRPGAYYRPQGIHHEMDPSKIKKGNWVTFVDQNSDFVGLTPHYMIKEFMFQYIKTRKLDIDITEFHNAMWYMGEWAPRLRNFLSCTDLDGIVMPSIYAFACDTDLRLELWYEAVKNNIQLLFCDENILVTEEKDIELIKKLYAIEKKNNGMAT